MPNYTYHHTHILSPDPKKTAAFYESVFGAERVATEESGGNVRLQLNLCGEPLFIMAPPPGTPLTENEGTIGLNHLGLMTDDLDTSIADIKAHGGSLRDEIITIMPGVRICFVWGPEKVLIELIEVKINQ